MSNDNVLTQEEIDALLDEVDNTGLEKQSDGKGGDGVKLDGSDDLNDEIDPSAQSIDFSGEERIVRGQLPVLEKIYDRMSKMVMEDIFALMSRDLTITQDPFVIMKSQEFMPTLKLPLYITVTKAHPLRGKLLIVQDGKFIYEMVEHYYGGHSEYAVTLDEDKDLTPTELAIVENITKLIKKNLIEAWNPIIELQLDIISSETNPQMLSVFTGTELLVITRFECSFEKKAGTFFVIFPYNMIEPIKERLELGLSQGDDEFDPRWTGAIKRELLRAPLELSSVLAKREILLSEVVDWKEGSFIPLEMNDVVPVYVEKILCFKGKVGTHNDKCAIEILEKVKHE